MIFAERLRLRHKLIVIAAKRLTKRKSLRFDIAAVPVDQQGDAAGGATQPLKSVQYIGSEAGDRLTGLRCLRLNLPDCTLDLRVAPAALLVLPPQASNEIRRFGASRSGVQIARAHAGGDQASGIARG